MISDICGLLGWEIANQIYQDYEILNLDIQQYVCDYLCGYFKSFEL